MSVVAKAMGVSYERCLRQLHALNEQNHGMVLVPKPGTKKPSYVVYLSVLRKVSPEIFETALSVQQQLEEQAEELSHLRRGMEQMARALGELRRGQPVASARR